MYFIESIERFPVLRKQFRKQSSSFHPLPRNRLPNRPSTHPPAYLPSLQPVYQFSDPPARPTTRSPKQTPIELTYTFDFKVANAVVLQAAIRLVAVGRCAPSPAEGRRAPLVAGRCAPRSLFGAYGWSLDGSYHRSSGQASDSWKFIHHGRVLCRLRCTDPVGQIICILENQQPVLRRQLGN